VRTAALLVLAGVFEIGGGYLVWLWLRERRSVLLGLAGFVALALYGVVPVLQEQARFGRIYAAYGGVFVMLSMVWGWSVEGKRPDLRDWVGGALCVVGAAVILWPRAVEP